MSKYEKQEELKREELSQEEQLLKTEADNTKLTDDSKNVKMTNPMKVITGPNTRWSYANVWEPKSINGGTPKYSVSLIIPKSDTKTVAKIEAAIEAGR